MGSIAEQYVDRYYNEYDDTDRYCDYIYDIYEQLNESIADKNIIILDNNTFADFFTFYVSHMDRTLVDSYLISTHLGQLRRELGKLCGESSRFKYKEELCEPHLVVNSDGDVI